MCDMCAYVLKQGLSYKNIELLLISFVLDDYPHKERS